MSTAENLEIQRNQRLGKRLMKVAAGTWTLAQTVRVGRASARYPDGQTESLLPDLALTLRYNTVRHLAAAEKRKIKMKGKSVKRIKSKRKSRSRVFDYKKQSRYSWSHPNLNPNLALTPLPNLTLHPALTLCGAAELRTVI
jgi:hypothetical protein